MRTNVVIEDQLIARAMESTGLKTKKAVIEEALRTLIRLKSQERARDLRGKLHWEGNLDEMREGRLMDVDR
jgi:Arc/MetJ family transcription regulator